MNIKTTLAAATLLAGLTATGAVAATGNRFPSTPSSFENNVRAAGPCKEIYLSDATAGSDLLYTIPGYASYTPMPALPAADNGWGLYAARKAVYAGESVGKIDIYLPCTHTEIHPGPLTTAGYAPPFSIAVDYANNVYASEFGNPTIDWFTAGGVDTATTTDATYRSNVPYYLAVDNVGNVYTSGWDPTSSFEQIDVCTPHMTSCTFCEAIPGPSWPGGLAVDEYQHLIVNNEIGSIYVYNAGCGTLASSSVYSATNSLTHFHFAPITVDKNENAIFGAKQFDVSQVGCTTPYCMDAQALHYTAITGTVGAVAPAAHTPIIAGNQPGSGIAIWPPGPI